MLLISASMLMLSVVWRRDGVASRCGVLSVMTFDNVCPSDFHEKSPSALMSQKSDVMLVRRRPSGCTVETASMLWQKNGSFVFCMKRLPMFRCRLSKGEEREPTDAEVWKENEAAGPYLSVMSSAHGLIWFISPLAVTSLMSVTENVALPLMPLLRIVSRFDASRSIRASRLRSSIVAVSVVFALVLFSSA